MLPDRQRHRLGDNITIYDGIESATYGSTTYKAIGSGIGAEDNEAEPHMIQTQAWDLEGFFLNSTRTALTIVGGYDFYKGYSNTTAGDIFIDTNGDAVASPNLIPGFTYSAYQKVSNSYFKYDYVLDIDWVAGTFDIIKLDANSILKDTEYGATYNQASNPWIYLNDGDNTGTDEDIIVDNRSFNTYGKSSQTGTGFSDWDGDNTDDPHFVGTFDISEIDLSNGGLFHNTMECGNDNLIGKVAPVPEPATMLLFGTGIAGLAGSLRRRRMNKK